MNDLFVWRAGFRVCQGRRARRAQRGGNALDGVHGYTGKRAGVLRSVVERVNVPVEERAKVPRAFCARPPRVHEALLGEDRGARVEFGLGVGS